MKKIAIALGLALALPAAVRAQTPDQQIQAEVGYRLVLGVVGFRRRGLLVQQVLVGICRARRCRWLWRLS